ncbi:MAG: hypothetical protein JF588_11375 [Caulobacterales bacterium]|nr:hypothetical protein [Caulobacterales bacterium]
MTRPRCAALLALPLLALGLAPGLADARPASRAPVSAPRADADAADLALFDRRAALAKDLGATDMVMTEGLPASTWEFDASDPYPAWFVHHASLLKIFPAGAVTPFIDAAYVRHAQAVVAARCAILAKHGLRGVWRANEPAVLPEAFFTAHPELRGPRIDHPARSRKTHFAPNVDRPEMLAIYRESMQSLLKACPQIETFSFVTTDAGSGFDWTPGLYPGANGASDVRDRPIADRVAGFMTNLQQAAHDAGHEVRISITQIEPRQWMIPTFAPDVLENTVRKLPRGLAVNGREGPDGRPFETGAGGGGGNPFYPVVGLSVPSFAATPRRDGGRLQVDLGDNESLEFNARLLKATRGLPMGTLADRTAALRAFAASEAGEAQADNLMEAWSALNDVKRYLDVLDFGPMLRMGHVLNRWITRPMVPYPLELTEAEKADYRPFLFQAKGEAQAADLVDIQAMRMYEGWGAKLLFQRDIELANARAERALGLVQGVAAAAPTPEARAYWRLTGQRIQALIYLMRSADDMVGYQAQLDRVNALGVKPEPDAVLGVQAGWDRTDLMATARREIDTMVALQALLQSADQPILDLAPSQAQETIMRLGPDTPRQLKHKVDIMNAHWRDYDRLFTVPNP